MQNTERVVMKRNNQSVFIDKFADNVAEYFTMAVFSGGQLFIFLDQLLRLWQKTVAIFSPAQRRSAFSTPGSCYFGQKSTKCPKTIL